jgi:hypothetical protein
MAATGDDQTAQPGFESEALPRLVCIAGAPRCGTTSLAQFLRTHPDICFSRIKEPHFFSRFDLERLGDEELRSTIRHHYLERYFRWDGRSAVLAEGSVSYLYAAEHMRPLVRAWPNAKFIISVRDPLELLPSFHQRLLFLGDETETDFGKAWRLNGERASGRRIPRTCVDPRLLRYDEMARLGKHLAKFLDVVGDHRCLVILHEDLAADARAAYRRVQEFIGVTPLEPSGVHVHRASVGYRIGWLQRLLFRPPMITRSLLRGPPHLDGARVGRMRQPRSIPRVAKKLRGKLLRWNQAPAPQPVIPTDVRREICETLADDVLHLSRLIGRNLDHWLDGTVGARAARNDFPADIGEARRRAG